MSGEDDEESGGGEADPPITEETAFDLGAFAASDPEGLPPGEAAVSRELEEIRRVTGGFALNETASDRIMRDIREGSALQRAIREVGSTATDRIMRDVQEGSALQRAIRELNAPTSDWIMQGVREGSTLHSAIRQATGVVGGLTANSTSRSLIEQAEAAAAGDPLMRKRGHVGSFLDHVEPSVIASLADQSIGSGVLRAARGSVGGTFADDALRSSLSRLREEFGDRYERAIREITGMGSLGGVAARLASGRADDLSRTRSLLEDAAAKAAAAIEASVTGPAFRRAHATLLPPLRRPTADEIERIVSATGPWSTLSPYPDWMARAQAGVTGLAAPWVREDRPDLSLAAMARFGRLGGTVVNLDPRDQAVTEELRGRLGDYRGEPVDEEAEGDPALRVAERYDRGFDPVLSSMPTRIVLAMLAPFGLRFDPEAADGEFGIDDIAAQMIRRIEAKLLALVRDALEAAWGDEWIMHVPGDVRSRLRRRQRQAEARGRPAEHLIVHADFGDWIAIIGLDENWPLFAARFGSLDMLRETLEQIRPIRHDASHPRGVGPEDLLVLAANGTRLLRLIGSP